jgi:hypothetical protein
MNSQEPEKTEATLKAYEMPIRIQAENPEQAGKIFAFFKIFCDEIKPEEIGFLYDAVTTHPQLKSKFLGMVRNTQYIEKFMKSSLGKGLARMFGGEEAKEGEGEGKKRTFYQRITGTGRSKKDKPTEEAQ